MAVRIFVPVPPAPEENLIVPEYPVWTTTPLLTVAVGPVVKGTVKVSKPSVLTGELRRKMLTGTDPPLEPGPVVVIVLPPPSVNAIGVFDCICCVNCRMVSALADVAIASEAKAAIANLDTVECMVLFLPLWWSFSLNQGKASRRSA